jgi:hypothetical protein
MTEKEKAQSIAKLLSKAKAKAPKRSVKVVVAKGANRGIQGRPKVSIPKSLIPHLLTLFVCVFREQDSPDEEYYGPLTAEIFFFQRRESLSHTMY